MNLPITKAMVGVLAIALLVAASIAVGFAEGEQSGRDGVEVSLDGSVSPNRLPRNRSVPVSITISGTIASSIGTPLRRLDTIEIAFGAHGALDSAGLPTCPRSPLRNATQRQALARCRPALIGRGMVSTEVLLAPEKPIIARARVLAFNGEEHGHPAVWVHAYSASPPVSFVLPFRLHRLYTGTYGILLRAPVFRALGRWPRLRSFSITFGRRYSAGGERRSYLNARCPLPPRFHVLNFPLARATYRFSPALTLTTTILRACRVRD